MSILRSGLRSTNALLRRPVNTAAGRSLLSSKRLLSSSAHDDEYETAKWEKITLLGIATCTTVGIYLFYKGEEHFPEPPPYPYLHIRNKEFPWGSVFFWTSPDGLFEKKKHDH